MACPLEAAAELDRILPPGPVLELCCGLGGITRALARTRRVTAIDRDPDRLAANRANLAGLGPAPRVDYLCCDLSRPGLRAPREPYAACVLDPDWSPPRQPVGHWAHSLARMSPPAARLMAWARSFSPLVVIRLPQNQVLEELAGQLLLSRPKYVFLACAP